MSNQLVVTRHKALLEYLIENDIVKKDVEHLTFAYEADVEGKDVFGILPLRLACLTNTLTELQLRLPPEKRGLDLSIEDLNFFKPKIVTYKITKENEK